MLLLLLACAPPDTPVEPTAYLDSLGGKVRVHYAPEGVRTADVDEDGIPDQPQEYAVIAEEVLRLYEMEGFAAPMTEHELGLDGLGGSDALDIYLVDTLDDSLAGQAVHGACLGMRCGGWVEVDVEARDAERLVAHEIFHLVQGAYSVAGAAWFREGSADWALQEFRGYPENGGGDWAQNHACGLASIHWKNPCAIAKYDVSHLWEFFAKTIGDDVLRESLEELMIDPDGIDAVDRALARHGTTLSEQWPVVAAWNLATGPRYDWAGGYDNASDIDGLEADAEGFPLSATANIEPLSARYYRLDHPGGDLWMGVAGATAHLRVSVHPVRNRHPDGPLDPMEGPFGLPVGAPLNLGRYEPGGIWVTVSNPELHGVSTPVDLCFDTTPCTPGCGGLGLAPVGLIGLRSLARRGRATPPKRSSRALG